MVTVTVAAVATVTEVVEATTTIEGDTRYVETSVFELHRKEISFPRFPTRSDIIQPVQSLKKARSLKF